MERKYERKDIQTLTKGDVIHYKKEGSREEHYLVVDRIDQVDGQEIVRGTIVTNPGTIAPSLDYLLDKTQIISIRRRVE